MESVSTNYFDGPVAEGYDSDAEIFAPAVVDPVVDFLADLAGTGSALELAIGTGRIGLPLSQRGVTVHGIELSPAMVAQLKAKPGAEDIPVSYTHLDVYKRQPSPVVRDPPAWPPRTGSRHRCTASSCTSGCRTSWSHSSVRPCSHGDIPSGGWRSSTASISSGPLFRTFPTARSTW